MLTDRSSSHVTKRVGKDSGNTSSTTVQKDQSSKGKSSAKLKAASWSTSGWRHSYPALRSTISELKISTSSSVRHTISKSSRSIQIAKTSSSHAESFLEEERISRKAELLENIHEGDVRHGVVKNITDFGVFLDLDGIDGLLHITDMTWKRIKHPSEMVNLGQEIEVIILHVDKDKGRVALGMKQKESNPWEEIEQRYPPGTRVRGKIVNLVPYGAFIEIEPGIEGLIHVSEMSWVKNVTDPSEVVKKGDEVEAIVLSVQKEEGKISLGLKQIETKSMGRSRKEIPDWKQCHRRNQKLDKLRGLCRIRAGNRRFDSYL